MDDSNSSTIRIIVLSDTNRYSPRTGQWCNAGSRFRGTRTLPYAYWGSACQSEIAPALGENAFCRCVLDCSRYSEAEWENEGIRRRPKSDQRTQWNGGRETGMHRWTDKIPRNRRKWWERSARSGHFAREGWLFCLTRPVFKEIAILWSHSSILSDESVTIRVNVRLQRKGKKQRQIQLTKNTRVSAPYLSVIRTLFFVSPIRVSPSSLSVPLIIWIHFGCLETFFDQGRRLLEGSRVQSRFRGTRTMPYTHVSCGTGHSFRDTRIMPYALWSSDCWSERAPALRKNLFWCCVQGRTERDAVVILRQSGRMKEFGGGRRPTKGHSGTKEERNTSIIE